MEFFVPWEDGSGPMPRAEAEQAWMTCREGAEQDAGQEALARRVYSLRYWHNGRELTATVGKLAPYDDRERVIAIVAFGSGRGFYKICSVVGGYRKIEDTPIVGGGSVLAVEDFTLAGWPPEMV